MKEKNEDADFTLYVNGKYMDSIKLNKINPYKIASIKIWKKIL